MFRSSLIHQLRSYLLLATLTLVAVLACDASDIVDKLPFNLDEGWKSEKGGTFSVPFVVHELEPLILQKDFRLDSVVSKQLFLHFARLAWDAELEINGKYIGHFQRPFDTWTIPLDPEWLYSGTNSLRLRLYHRTQLPFHPKPLLGILGEVILLEKSDLDLWQKEILGEAAAADTVAMVAPWYREKAYLFDSTEAIISLLPLLEKKHRYIYFPFPPGREMEQLCADLGFKMVPSLEKAEQIFFLNAYPFEGAAFPMPPIFWLNESGARTEEYGHYPHTSEFKKNRFGNSYELGFSLLVLFPLIALFLIKILVPGFFQGLPGLTIGPILYIGNLADNTNANSGILIVLILLKMIAMTIFLSLAIHYISLENQWQFTSFFSKESLLKRYFYGSTSLGGICWKSFLFFLTWFFLKHGIILLIGSSFRIKNFLSGSLNLEIIGSYPLVLFLALPLGFMFFMENLWGGALIYFLLFLLAIYLVRKIYVHFSGLDKLFTFSPGMKFLYICTFNILPYVLFL